MRRHLDACLLGAMKRLVNGKRLCFHKRGPLVVGVGEIEEVSTP